MMLLVYRIDTVIRTYISFTSNGIINVNNMYGILIVNNCYTVDGICSSCRVSDKL